MPNIRRSRGYAWEKHIVSYFNSKKDYHSRRLGGSSTGLPDIVITNNKKSLLYSIEAKSVTTYDSYIAEKQIVRCHDILDMFSLYEHKYVLFAFKFGVDFTDYQQTQLKKKRKIGDVRTYIFKVTKLTNPFNIRFVNCNYNGLLTYKPKSVLKEKDVPELRADKYLSLDSLYNPNSSLITT